MTPKGKIVISRNIRALKKTWGVPIVYYRYLAQASDYTTGVQSINWQTYPISKGILLPKSRNGLDRLASIIHALNPSFAKMTIDVDSRELLIDAKDFPSTYTDVTRPDLKDKVIVDAEVYDVISASMYEYGAAFYFILKYVPGVRSIE